MECFVEWKVDDEIDRSAGLLGMWQPRNGCEVGSAKNVITKQREGNAFQSWTNCMHGISENALKIRNAMSL